MPHLVMDDEDGELAMLRDSVAAPTKNHPNPKTTQTPHNNNHDMDTTQ
jgi:hypothetical protein